MERADGQFERLLRVTTIVGRVLAVLITIQLVVSITRAQWGRVVGAAGVLVTFGAVTWLRNRLRLGLASFLIVGGVLVICGALLWLAR